MYIRTAHLTNSNAVISAMESAIEQDENGKPLRPLDVLYGDETYSAWFNDTVTCLQPGEQIVIRIYI